MPVGINEGTQTFITSTTNGTEVIPNSAINGGTLAALTNGTVRMSVGTLTTGTLQNLNFGTVDTFYRHPDSFATVVSTGTLTLGTIKAAVSGSQIFVTDLIISAGSATNVEIASGGTSTPITGTLYLNANGGAVMNFKTPIRTVAGSALVFKQSSAISPLSITAQGYVD